MAILVDGSTPAIAVQTDGTIATVVTASFTPPPGSTLLIRYSANTIDPTDPGAPTITDNRGTHLTYTSLDVGKRSDSPAADGQVATWIAPIPAGSPTAMTVTVTNGAASPNRHAALLVTVLTGTSSAMFGAHGKNAANTTQTTIAASFTGTALGSRGFLVTSDWADVGAQTAGTATSLEGSADVAANYVYGFFRAASNSGTVGGTTTLNVNIPGAGSNSLHWAWVEITPMQEGSAPGTVPTPLLYQLALWKLRQQDVSAAAGTPTSAETGLAALAIVGTGAAVKVAVQTGSAVLAVRGSGVGAKRAAVAGTAEVAIRQGGAEIHQQAQTGTAEVAVRGTAAVTKIGKGTGTAGVAVAGTGTAAKKAPATGTAVVAVAGTGAEASGTSRQQTGAGLLPIRQGGVAAKRAVVTGTAMLATVGAGADVKRAPETGAALAAVRGSALAVKKAAAAGRGAITLATSGAGGKRAAVAGRTVVPVLGYGIQSLFLPPVRLGERLDEILNALVTFTLRLGIFQRVQQHEPKSAPRNGLTAALWLQAMEPALGESSLGSTSLRVSWYLRIYQNFLSEPQDLIDPSVMKACASVMEALTANFDLDITAVRAIDILGMTGPPMRAEAGYVPMGPPNAQKIYRCMTLTIPIIVDDAFVQAA